jgi:TetR/AcrR family transcriptional repressor of nem operon
LREQRQGVSAAARSGAGIEDLVRAYLSAEQRDHRERGCPSAALLEEIARSTDATKQAYTEGALAVIDDLVAALPAQEPQSLRLTALSLYAAMAGTLQMSRALADRTLADAILEQGIRNTLALLGITQRD